LTLHNPLAAQTEKTVSRQSVTAMRESAYHAPQAYIIPHSAKPYIIPRPRCRLDGAALQSPRNFPAFVANPPKTTLDERDFCMLLLAVWNFHPNHKKG